MPKALFSMLKQAFSDWNEDNAPRMGAALAYYTIFSIAPLLLIAIGIAGLVFGAEAAQGRIVEQLDGLVGRSGAEAVQTMLQNAHKPESGLVATVIGAITLLLGASGVFTELRAALNAVWNVPAPRKGGIMKALKDRFASFAMILVVGFLLLVSLLLSAGLSAFGKYVGGFMPGTVVLLQVLNVVVSLAVITALFAMIYKLLPDTRIEWRDVWVGAAITSALFVVGKFAIGLYLGRSSVASTYGAAGSVVVLLVWVYYAAQILFFGAELSHVYAVRHGSRKDAPETEEEDDTRAADTDDGDRDDEEDSGADEDEDDDREDRMRRARPYVRESPLVSGTKPAAGTAFLVGAIVAGALSAMRRKRASG
jgi:membrane protein